MPEYMNEERRKLLKALSAELIITPEIGKNKVIVTVLPDRAERYFSTELFESF